jgi:hypothetical protein
VLADVRNERAGALRDIDQAHLQLGQPFKHAAALDEARTRQNDIRQRIASAAAPPPAVSDETSPAPSANTVVTASTAPPSFRDRLNSATAAVRSTPESRRAARDDVVDLGDQDHHASRMHSHQGPRQ